MIAVVPVRAGTLPAGGFEAVAECDGRALLVGEGTAEAANALGGTTEVVQVWEAGRFAPAAWAAALGPVLAAEEVVVLPASPDGRDLAPRLARELGRPVLAGAIRVRPHGAEVARWGGLVLEDLTVDGPFVATLQPGVRGGDGHHHAEPPSIEDLALGDAPSSADPELDAVLPPDVTTMDLAEAPRILGGGAGLASSERFDLLAEVATALGASMGATRVITDRGWVGHSRQIGTTGVVVDPRLYLAFGISGAVQHTSGLGRPDHMISVNTDPHCPMMQLADLAVVADANTVLDELARLLGVRATSASAAGSTT